MLDWRSPERKAEDAARRERSRVQRLADQQRKKEAEEHRRMERQRAYQVDAQDGLRRANEIYERHRTETTHYANVILLLGYGGFFALWSTLSDKMPRTWFGAAGLLMGCSLVLFLVFEVAKIAVSSIALTSASKQQLSDVEALGYMNSQMNKLDRFWAWFFIPAAATGFCAGGILLYAFWCNAMGGT